MLKNVLKHRRFIVIVAVMFALAIAVPSALASVYNGVVEITCEGWNASGTGSHVLDRDNTGMGMEALRVVAYDGSGRKIYQLDYQNVLATFGGGIGFDLWDKAPKFNPITWYLISKAGNGYDEQIDYVEVGTCPGLPTYTPPEEVLEEVPMGCNLDDGSLNFNDCGRPVAIFAGSIEVWGVDPITSKGALAFEVTDEEIEAAGVPEDAAVLLAQGVNPYTQAAIYLYRLPSGEFQLNTWKVGGKAYIVKWEEGDTVVTYVAW